MQKTSSILPIILIVILVACCCLIIALAGLGIGVYSFDNYLPTLQSIPQDFITPTPFDITRQPVDQTNSSTLQALEQNVVPERDLSDLACRLRGICDVPATLAAPALPYQLGAQKQFWLNNSDTGNYSRINTRLVYLTPHAYFWVEENTYYDQQEVEELVDTFEEQIYPTDRTFFGSEWTPGVDNDPHIYIIYTPGLGSSVAGYYMSLDEYNPLIDDHSNGIEAFYIDASQDLGDEYTYSTLAHEFQHMIHWYQDSNESSFLDEGFAELAAFLNGYDPGGFDRIYTSDPDIALTDWRDSGENGVHYGANFLFVTYFLDRFGEQATQALVHNQQNELDSVDSTLSELGITDPLTSQVITADDFFLDWALTNYIHDGNVSDGRFIYHNYPNSPTARDTEWISTCPSNTFTRTVNQYGVDYLRISCPGEHNIQFTGATLTPLLPADPHSGEFAFWSNKANESNTSLTRQFDFSAVSGPITLNYWVWYDLEPDYDYAYLEASTDGINWEILITPSGTSDDPAGSAYGWGYTGLSDGWVQESVDLSQFAGQVVTLRFDYVTDAVLVNAGLLLDDISIPEIDYSANFESGEDGWVAAGFVRIQNILPQTYRLALIHYSGNTTSVEILTLSPDQTADIPISQSGDAYDVLVVTATTRFTNELAPYQITIH
jgi:immune inhibitor A